MDRDIINCRKEMLLMANKLKKKHYKTSENGNGKMDIFKKNEFIHQSSKKMLKDGKYSKKEIIKVRVHLIFNPAEF